MTAAHEIVSMTVAGAAARLYARAGPLPSTCEACGEPLVLQDVTSRYVVAHCAGCAAAAHAAAVQRIGEDVARALRGGDPRRRRRRPPRG